jgi:hypothetical protein
VWCGVRIVIEARVGRATASISDASADVGVWGLSGRIGGYLTKPL